MSEYRQPALDESGAWQRRRIEKFVLACVEVAQEHEIAATRLRALAAKVAAPPPDTRIELTHDPYTIRFVKEIR